MSQGTGGVPNLPFEKFVVIFSFFAILVTNQVTSRQTTYVWTEQQKKRENKDFITQVGRVYENIGERIVMTINLGDTHISLNLFGTIMVLVLIILFLLILFIWNAKSVAKCKWSCPKCYTVFNITWKQVFPPIHYGNEYWIKCPKCKKRYYCVESHQEWLDFGVVEDR